MVGVMVGGRGVTVAVGVGAGRVAEATSTAESGVGPPPRQPASKKIPTHITVLLQNIPRIQNS